MIRIILHNIPWEKSEYFNREQLIILGTQGTTEEIVATLAHELGHAKLRHGPAYTDGERIEFEILAWEWAKAKMVRVGLWTTEIRIIAKSMLASYGIQADAL